MAKQNTKNTKSTKKNDKGGKVFKPYDLASFNIYVLEHMIFQLGYTKGCKTPLECLQRFISSKQDKTLFPDFLLRDDYIYAICTEIYFWEKGDYPENQNQVKEWLSGTGNREVT